MVKNVEVPVVAVIVVLAVVASVAQFVCCYVFYMNRIVWKKREEKDEEVPLPIAAKEEGNDITTTPSLSRTLTPLPFSWSKRFKATRSTNKQNLELPSLATAPHTLETLNLTFDDQRHILLAGSTPIVRPKSLNKLFSRIEAAENENTDPGDGDDDDDYSDDDENSVKQIQQDIHSTMSSDIEMTSAYEKQRPSLLEVLDSDEKPIEDVFVRSPILKRQALSTYNL